MSMKHAIRNAREGELAAEAEMHEAHAVNPTGAEAKAKTAAHHAAKAARARAELEHHRHRHRPHLTEPTKDKPGIRSIERWTEDGETRERVTMTDGSVHHKNAKGETTIEPAPRPDEERPPATRSSSSSHHKKPHR